MAEAGAIMGRACEGFIGCQLSSIHSESNDYSRADIDRSTQRHQPRIGRSGRRAVARASIGAGGGWGATHGIRSPRWVRQSCSVVSWPESDEGRVSPNSCQACTRGSRVLATRRERLLWRSGGVTVHYAVVGPVDVATAPALGLVTGPAPASCGDTRARRLVGS